MIKLNIKELNKTVNKLSTMVRNDCASNVQNFQYFLQSTLFGYLPIGYRDIVWQHIDSYGEIDDVMELSSLENRVWKGVLLRLRKRHHYYKG